ncbi:hypothetical protein [Cystobacter fuscus]|uniref:hypothetical protein n=1 Tax=Cystobacter fuscus TaxID=43 RepID=UPI002B297A96|nr:hypothetical protein F0U63_35410 [Cystobacter fuscus]
MERAPYRALSLVILCAFVACAAAVGAGEWYYQHHRVPPGPETDLLGYVMGGWYAYDSGWYSHIVEHGYFYRRGEQSSVAFFPLYPLVVRAVYWLGLDVHQAGVLVTLLCGPLSVLLFLRWARTRVEPTTAFQAALLLALYPFTFFIYGVMYSDALFILVVVAAFILLEEGRLGPAVVLGALATAARPVAPAVVVGLLARRLEWKRERGLPWTAVDLLPLLSALGFVSFMLYLQWRFQEPLAFAKVQAAWGQVPGWRSWLKVSWFKSVFSPESTPDFVLWICLHAALSLGALALVWPTFKRLGWGYGAFCAVMVGIPVVSTKDFMGMGRYLLSAFPLFLTAAVLLRERPRLRRGILVVSSVSLLLLSTAFGLNYYFS